MLSRQQSSFLTLGTLVLLLVVTWQGSSTRSPARSSEVLEHQAPKGSSAIFSKPSSPLERISEALDKLENTPILPYEDALEINERTCSGRASQSNIDQINGESAFWKGLSSQLLGQKRGDVIKGVRDAFGLPGLLDVPDVDILKSPMYGEGRGIVYTGGNSDTLERVYNSMRILRYRCHSTLPVEIFSFPEEMQEQPGQGVRGKIEALGDVSFKVLRSSQKLKLWKNFQIKGEAIVKSSFAEVLYLDSDNILLADPSFLFESPVYKQYRAVFWPDITKDGPANPIWRMFGKQCPRNEWQLDSGQILIDKRGQQGMNLAGLLAATKMQEDHPFWFKLSGGDKDTFRYGFYALGLDYTASPHWLGSYGAMHNYETDGHTFCGLAMLQFSLSGDDWQHFPSAHPSAALKSWHAPPLFVHANLLKHSSFYPRGQIFTHVKRFREDRSDRASDRPRTVVYHSRQGMCVDIWDSFDDVDPRPGGTFSNGDIVLEEAKTAYGGVFDGFEEMFWHEGGKAGGT